jgi:hypothetical protein
LVELCKTIFHWRANDWRDAPFEGAAVTPEEGLYAQHQRAKHDRNKKSWRVKRASQTRLCVVVPAFLVEFATVDTKHVLSAIRPQSASRRNGSPPTDLVPQSAFFDFFFWVG